MSKIQIKVVLESNNEVSEEKYNAIQDKDKIIYQEKEYTVTLTTDNVVKLKRDNNDCLIEMEFIPSKETKVLCFLKKENATMELELLTDYVIIEEDFIKIKYKVLTTNQDVLYKLEVLK